MGRRNKKGRDINGILLLDKPLGITSNAALQMVKRLFFAKKAGHTGSLDPLATGLLPICLGEATKFAGYLLDSDKVYEGSFQLGINTATADSEGDIIQQRDVPELSDDDIKKAFAHFMGTIDQVPPMYSALKQNGQPLYKLARQGIDVERKARTIEIMKFDLLDRDGDILMFHLRCSKGTYVRSIAEDLGEHLGCGAFLKSLRRTEVGPFKIADVHSMDELEHIAADEGPSALDPLLLEMDQALLHWPAVNLTENSSFYILQGQPVLVPKSPTSGFVRLFGKDKEFIGIGQILDDGRIAPKRLIKNA